MAKRKRTEFQKWKSIFAKLENKTGKKQKFDKIERQVRDGE